MVPRRNETWKEPCILRSTGSVRYPYFVRCGLLRSVEDYPRKTALLQHYFSIFFLICCKLSWSTMHARPQQAFLLQKRDMHSSLMTGDRFAAHGSDRWIFHRRMHEWACHCAMQIADPHFAAWGFIASSMKWKHCVLFSPYASRTGSLSNYNWFIIYSQKN